MAKLSISDLYGKRRRFRFVTLIAVLVLTLVFIRMIVLDNPKSTQAGSVTVEDDGATVHIWNNVYQPWWPQTSYFSVDANGDLRWLDHVVPYGSYYVTGLLGNTNKFIDPRYYAYMAGTTPMSLHDGARWGSPYVYNIKGKNLIIENHVVVLMEGGTNYQLNSVTVKNGGKISQPFADRGGRINRPMYTGNNWGTEFTGYVTIPGLSSFSVGGQSMVCTWLHAQPLSPSYTFQPITSGQFRETQVWADDVLEIQIGDSGGNYQTVYRVSTNAGVAPHVGTTFQNYYNNSTRACNTRQEAIAIPIKVKFVEWGGRASFSIYENFMVYSTVAGGNWISAGDQYLTNGFIRSGVALDPGTYGKWNFSYYINRNNDYSIDFAPGGSFVRTLYVPNMDVASAFSGRGGRYYSGLTAYGTVNLRFVWSDYQNANNDAGVWQHNSPLGDNISVTGFEDRLKSSRHSAMGVNENILLYPGGSARRMVSGLDLQVNGALIVEGSKGIDLDGVGYPGWGKEFINSDADVVRNVGGGPGGGTSIQNDNTGNQGHGGAGWHARPGGIYQKGSGTGADTRPVYANPKMYGDASEFISTDIDYDGFNDSLGSGGGASLWESYSDYATVGGSGGGAVKIVAKRVHAGGYDAISAKGDIGFKPGNTPAGSGGAGGKIVIITDNFTTAGHTYVLSAAGADYNSAEHSSFSGGGGGYVTLIYSETNATFLTESSLYKFMVDISGGIGSSSLFNGQDGVMSIAQKKSADPGVSIKKKLVAVSRQGVSPANNFNPYALQEGDIIDVQLEVANVTSVLTTIKDEVLTLPTNRARCDLDVFTAAEGGNRQIADPPNTAAPPAGTPRHDYIKTTTPHYVVWNFIPNAGVYTVNMSYRCKVFTY